MKKITETMFIVLICIIMQGCGVQKNSAASPQYRGKMVYDNEGGTLYTVKVDALVSEFTDNVVAAKGKYMGKRVAVDGRISSIYNLPNGDPGLGFNMDYAKGGLYSGWWVDCNFSKVFSGDIAKLSPGQHVVVIGTVSDFSNLPVNCSASKPTVLLEDCILAQPVKNQ